MDYIDRNLTIMTDFYQLTMMNSYYKRGKHESMAYFDVFFRKSSTYVSYSIFAGLEQVVDYLQSLHFTPEDIAYLRSLKLFEEGFLEYLEQMKFTGDVWAVPEGTVVFPNEPLIRINAPLIQAQLIETAVLNLVNFQTLIASKASYILEVCQGDSVMEFGLRRAQGPDAGFFGARAAYIAGCAGTSNVLAGEKMGIPLMGTHAHSYVMSFPDELSAFMSYAKDYPENCLLLVDTYNTLKSGVPNAILTFEHLKSKGYAPKGIRIDSGDLAYLSKKAREMLDAAGFEEVAIVASGELDEQTILDLKMQDAKINAWGVGTRLITGWETPALGGVYKLCALEENGVLQPKMKISDNMTKTTNPGVKKVFRLYENRTGKAIADVVALEDEQLEQGKPLEIYDPIETWKHMRVQDFHCKQLLVPVMKRGTLVYHFPELEHIRAYCQQDLSTFWDEYKRLNKPQKYKVDLSDSLYDLRKHFFKEVQ